MAGQYEVAFAREVSGAGIVAAGPWGCAQGQIARALGACVKGDGLETESLMTLAQSLAADGRIDPLDALADDRVFLFHGAQDAIVSTGVVNAARRWYGGVLAAEHIASVYDVPATHGMPTADYGAACDAFGSPFINNCGYDLAGALLTQLYGTLAPPAAQVPPATAFEQASFGDARLNAKGYVYVPKACSATHRCRVHVFFHGCGQSAELIGDALVEHAGFNRWAETNDIVVLYPQTRASTVAPVNPLGCWDWWGYTGADYLARSGAQLAAVHRMVERLTAASP